jgi:Domain of unknown function (DUF4450)
MKRISIWPVIVALLGWLACTIVCAAPAEKGNMADQIDRPMRYHPDGTDFVIENGKEFFNRPLYGPNTAFRIDAGDLPEFSLYLPGRGGNVRLGILSGSNALWLNDAKKIVAKYRPGSMVYEITDPSLGSAVLQLTALPMDGVEGLVLQAEITGGNCELFWAYGGANGDRGTRGGDIGTEKNGVEQFFQLKPENCQNNSFQIQGTKFSLRARPGIISGLCSTGQPVTADANHWNSAKDLLDSAGYQGTTPLIVGKMALQPGKAVYLALQVEAEPNNLPQIFDAAEKHRAAIAQQIVVQTPDDCINAAAAALCVAGNGVWDERQGAFMHGAVAWREKLLGWRGPYLGDDLGWFDRLARHLTSWGRRQNVSPIPETIAAAEDEFNLSRHETALHSNGDISNTHYDMNLVYVDELMRHLLWTGDLQFARQMWPVIERHLAWEQRLFRRTFGNEKLPLYEGYCCIWASDDLEYSGGGAAHASAYNYFQNLFAARLAKLLGKDPTPYDQEAKLIADGMQQQLWLNDRGWFAEYKDLLGLQQVHPSAALWTFYTTVDSQVPTPMQAWQMSRGIDTQIAHIPLRGPGVPYDGCFTLPTTNWMPYTWSTNNVVMAEAAHTSLAYWQSGRDETAFELFKGCLLDSMFMGKCPGNAGMCTTFDMARGETQRDFADAVGTCSRALIEGLFGIQPDALAGELVVRPGFPEKWDHASLKHPAVDFAFDRSGLNETYQITPHFDHPMALRLQTAALRSQVQSVTVNGQPAPWNALEDGVGRPRIEILIPSAQQWNVSIVWNGDPLATVKIMATVVKGETFESDFAPADLIRVEDPQSAFGKRNEEARSITAVANGAIGDHTAFAQLHQGDLTWWAPISLEIRPAMQILPEQEQDADHLRFRIRNNSAVPIDQDVAFAVGDRTVQSHVKMAAMGESEPIALPSQGILPGTSHIETTLGKGDITNWNIKALPSTALETINLEKFFNDRVTNIFKNRYVSPRSPFCSLAIPVQGIGSWCRPDAQAAVDDSGLPASGKIVLPDGIPFAASAGKNIAFVSQWDNYPRQIEIPLNVKAKHLYLLMAGSTNSMQSRFRNGEIVVTFTDDSTQKLELENPTNWWPIDQDYLIDDFAFSRPQPLPPRINLKTGEVRMLDMAEFKGHGGKIAGGAATVLDMPLRDDLEMKSVTIRAVANEVVVGLMSLTVARAD